MDTLRKSHIASLRKLATGIISVSERMNKASDPQYDGPIVFHMPTLTAELAEKLLVLINQYENMELDKAVDDSLLI